MKTRYAIRIRAIFIVLAALSVSLFLPKNSVMAGSTQPPLYKTDFHPIKGVSWSSDSRFLIFYEGGDNSDTPAVSFPVGASDGKWWEYDSQTNLLVSTNEWPNAPQYTQADQDTFHISPDLSSFVSPDKRYVVYPGDEVNFYEASAFKVVIGDRIKGQFSVTNGLVVYPLFGLESFNVLWNRSSLSFIISSTSANNLPLFTYYSQYKNKLSDVKSIDLAGITINKVVYQIDTPYDISDDGNLILAHAVMDNDPSKAALLLVNMTDASQSIVVKGINGAQVIGAHFDTVHKDQFLVINKVGIIDYALNTHKTSVLNPHINSTLGGSTIFSPDNSKVVVLHFNNGYVDSLYLASTTNPDAFSQAAVIVPTPPLNLQPLVLTAECSPKPDFYREWQVSNANSFAIAASWILDNTAHGQGGLFTVPGAQNGIPGTITFETRTEAAKDTVIIFANEIQQDTKTGISDQCPA